MAKKKNKQPKISNEEIRHLVIERLGMFSPNKGISIGLSKSYTKDELIQEVKKGSKIGEKIIKVEIEFLRSLKDLPFYGTEINSDI